MVMVFIFNLFSFFVVLEMLFIDFLVMIIIMVFGELFGIFMKIFLFKILRDFFNL